LILERTILNDQKSAKMISLLEEYRHDNPTMTDRVDNEFSTISIPSDHRTVMGAIKEA